MKQGDKNPVSSRSHSYLALGFRALALSEFMATAFHIAVLAISSEMFTTDGSKLQEKHTTTISAA